MGRDFETLQLHPTLATRLYSILNDLKGLGYSPVLSSGWRTQSEHAKIIKAKRTRVPWSFHQYRLHDTPASMAVHVTDSSMYKRGVYAPPENKNHPFWVDLERSASRHGLYTGRQWKTLFDPAHVQLYDNSLRRLVAAGKEIPFAGGLRMEPDWVERAPFTVGGSAAGLLRKFEMDLAVGSAMRDKRPIKLKVDTSLASDVNRMRQTAEPINWVRQIVGAGFAERPGFDVHLDPSLDFRLKHPFMR